MRSNTYTTCKIPCIAAKVSTLVIVLAGFSIPCLGSEQSASAVRRTSRLSTLKIVQLPEPKNTGQLSFEEALAKQQSIEPPSIQRLQMQ
jgi:hypothetical protein